MIDISDFSARIIQSTPEEIIQYVADNRNPLKLTFINLEIIRDTIDRCSSILMYLSSLQLPVEVKESNEIQFLYKELGLFFKKANKQGLVANCSNQLVANIFKNRLKAWLHHKHYTNAESHCKLFASYLEKLSIAITDGNEDYENDVLRDLHNYYLDTMALLEKRGHHVLMQEFEELFESETLIGKYKLLDIYQRSKNQFTAGLLIVEENHKIYEPSVFTDALFEDKFLAYIRNHQNTVWYEILLGYPTFTIRNEIINFGQAHFDNSYGALSSSDIVKLYSYFNMRKHYYSTLYLLERFNRLQDFHGTNGRIKFIDIGCGPATSGIALTDHIHAIGGSEVSFDYFGVDCYQSMRTEAAYMMDNGVYENNNSTFYLERLGDIDYEDLNNANSIYINTCYLFASDSLNEVELAKDVLNVKKAQGEVPFYILFQNTTDATKSVKYNNFKEQIGNFTVRLEGTSLIRYNNRRNSYFSPTEEAVYFEILEIE
ncbi:hypothetical protein [Sphingobacterium multivorum]|uniref:hypothetical protein n=1 Tax=Sphingobacterium multivorum TaxID=28454 RepID=UPI002FD8E6BA